METGLYLKNPKSNFSLSKKEMIENTQIRHIMITKKDKNGENQKRIASTFLDIMRIQLNLIDIIRKPPI